MDGTLCNFLKLSRERLQSNPSIQFPQSQYGFFIELEPLPGAIESYKLLEKVFDVRILTRPSSFNIGCYSEKAYWVLKHLGFEAQRKMVLSEDKSIVKGDFLIDDEINAGQLEFEGELISFGKDPFSNWPLVIEYLSNKF